MSAGRKHRAVLEAIVDDPQSAIGDKIRAIELLERTHDNGGDTRDFLADLDAVQVLDEDGFFTVDVVRAIYANEPVAGIDPAYYPATATLIRAETERLLRDQRRRMEVEGMQEVTQPAQDGGAEREAAAQVGDREQLLLAESALHQARQRLAEAQSEVAYFQERAELADQRAVKVEEERVRDAAAFQRSLAATRQDAEELLDLRHQLATEREANAQLAGEVARLRASGSATSDQLAQREAEVARLEISLEDERDQHARTRNLSEGRILR